MFSQKDQTKVAYCPFRTMLNSFDLLRQQALPSEINRSVWSSMSGAIAGQLLGAYRFLGLIDDLGKPQTPLVRIHSQPDKQAEIMNDLLQQAYPEILALRLETLTQRQLDEAFDRYEVTGATHRKAVSFFLQAGHYAGLQMSGYLTKRRGRKRRNGSTRVKAESGSNQSLTGPTDLGAQGTTKTIFLRSSGSLSVSVVFDAFAISQEDRNFVFGIIDQLTKYDRTPAAPRRVLSSPIDNEDAIADDDVPF